MFQIEMFSHLLSFIILVIWNDTAEGKLIIYEGILD